MNALQGQRQLLEDEVSFKPKHPVTKVSELPIAPGISGTTLPVARAIDFDDKPGLRSNEVDDVAPDWHLAAKRNAQLTRANSEPQGLLGG